MLESAQLGDELTRRSESVLKCSRRAVTDKVVCAFRQNCLDAASHGLSSAEAKVAVLLGKGGVSVGIVHENAAKDLDDALDTALQDLGLAEYTVAWSVEWVSPSGKVFGKVDGPPPQFRSAKAGADDFRVVVRVSGSWPIAGKDPTPEASSYATSDDGQLDDDCHCDDLAVLTLDEEGEVEARGEESWWPLE